MAVKMEVAVWPLVNVPVFEDLRVHSAKMTLTNVLGVCTRVLKIPSVSTNRDGKISKK
jgi:hypothetical protein